ncbi:MAG: hypothetical protein JNK33_06340 [Candidatus Doudnabacteria bacterium]|nr:hypothetical protein [Candidatus Doudnabacteria bacterium]
MNEGMNINRPAAPRAESEVMHRQQGGSKLPWIVLALVVVVLVVVAILFRDKLFAGKSGDAMTAKAGEYQAVFLTNGQVYFGKLSEDGGRYIKLTDIYYLQVNQPQIQGSQQTTQQAQQQPQLQLVKLGNELHGPVDEMHINRDQVLFFEDMKADGKVAQAIKEYKANPAGANKPATQAQPEQQPAPTPAPAVAPTPAPAPAPAAR